MHAECYNKAGRRNQRLKSKSHPGKIKKCHERLKAIHKSYIEFERNDEKHATPEPSASNEKPKKQCFWNIHWVTETWHFPTLVCPFLSFGVPFSSFFRSSYFLWNTFLCHFTSCCLATIIPLRITHEPDVTILHEPDCSSHSFLSQQSGTPKLWRLSASETTARELFAHESVYLRTCNYWISLTLNHHNLKSYRAIGTSH